LSSPLLFCFTVSPTRHPHVVAQAGQVSKLQQIPRNMADIQVRRLPVLTRDKRLVGIISLGDKAVTEKSGRAGEAVAGISQPGGQHSQTGGSRT
jgi:CBS-domain-containing membrane protein